MSDVQYTPKETDGARLNSQTTQKVQKKSLPVLLVLNRRAVIFWGLQTIALILFYISGNTQHFLEANMKIVLWAMTVSSIGLALFCLAGVGESIFYAISLKRFRLLFKLIPYGTILVLSVTFAIFSRTLDLLSLGYQ